MLQLLLFTAFLTVWTVFFCGKASKKKTAIEDEKKAADAKRAAEEAKAKKEKEHIEKMEMIILLRIVEERLIEEGNKQEEQKVQIASEYIKGKDKNEIEELVRGKSYKRETDVEKINSCKYYEEFLECDIDLKMREIYCDARNLVSKILGTGKDVEVKKWLELEVKLAEIYIPFFEQVVNDFYDAYHKDHSKPDVLEKLKKVHQTIVDHHKKIEAAWKSIQEKGGAAKKISELSNEEWKVIEIFPTSTSKTGKMGMLDGTRTLIPGPPTCALLDTCKVEFGGECDFVHRVDRFVYLERLLTEPSFSSGIATVGRVRAWLREDIRRGDLYLPEIEEKMEVHMNHCPDPEYIETSYEKDKKTIEEMKKYVKELEKKDAGEKLDVKTELERFPRPKARWTFQHGYWN